MGSFTFVDGDVEFNPNFDWCSKVVSDYFRHSLATQERTAPACIYFQDGKILGALRFPLTNLESTDAQGEQRARFLQASLVAASSGADTAVFGFDSWFSVPKYRTTDGSGKCDAIVLFGANAQGVIADVYPYSKAYDEVIWSGAIVNDNTFVANDDILNLIKPFTSDFAHCLEIKIPFHAFNYRDAAINAGFHFIMPQNDDLVDLVYQLETL